MNKALIDNWNSVVTNDDTVYHLGDFILGKAEFYDLYEIISKLKGKIKLIPGNHDTEKKLELYRQFPNIDILSPLYSLKKPKHIVLCHYPIYTWHHNHLGSWHLHGHCHGYLDREALTMDVGVDTHPEHRPYTFEEIKDFMKKKKTPLL